MELNFWLKVYDFDADTLSTITATLETTLGAYVYMLTFGKIAKYEYFI